MAIQIGTFEFNRLTAQPFAYDEIDTVLGRSARKWIINGLATPSEWLELLTIYDNWRNIRINEEDTEASGVIGTTVSFSGDGPGGQSWTNVACWFVAAPAGEQNGSYINISCELIDANQSLQVILRQAEAEEVEDSVDFGTFTLGGVTISLTKQADEFTDNPSLSLTALGSHYISGAKTVTQIKSIEGTTDQSGWNSLKSWYGSVTASTPATGSYYPVEPLSASAEIRTVNGVKSTVYIVNITLAVVK